MLTDCTKQEVDFNRNQLVYPVNRSAAQLAWRTCLPARHFVRIRQVAMPKLVYLLDSDERR